MRSEPLEPFYYLDNFEMVLASLRLRYADLLTAEEQSFISDFASLPVGSRAMFVRMMMRTGPFFRASKLKYREIGDPRVAIEPLTAAGWVGARPLLSLEHLRRLLTKAELVKCFSIREGGLELNACALKSELVAALTALYPETRTFDHWCPAIFDTVYKLCVVPLCERFRLMFFGNFRQDWSEFILAELGVFVYEKVDLAADSRPFSTRAQIDAFQQLHVCRELLHGASPPADVLAAMPAATLDSDWLEERRQKLLLQIGRQCERDGAIDMALDIYAGGGHGGARVRRIRMLERRGEWRQALTLCEQWPPDAQTAAERQQVERFTHRLRRKNGMPPAQPVRRVHVPQLALYLERTAEENAVEYRVRDALALSEPSSAVAYVENGLINSLFGLLCWRAVFAPLAGAFFHDFHHAPADLSSPHFFHRRAREFADCLSELDSDDYVHTIRAMHGQKSGIASPFVAWGLLDGALLELALTCFPAAHLRHWFEWIARDVRINRAGFPDLVQFWPGERRYRLIEVKGPGDRLQDNQRRLLEFCVAHGMPVCVCHVKWGGDSRRMNATATATSDAKGLLSA